MTLLDLYKIKIKGQQETVSSNEVAQVSGIAYQVLQKTGTHFYSCILDLKNDQKIINPPKKIT